MDQASTNLTRVGDDQPLPPRPGSPRPRSPRRLPPRLRGLELALMAVALPWPFLAALSIVVILPGPPFPLPLIDLEVYLSAAYRLLTGAPLYFDPPGPLPMIYPPFAAVLVAPLSTIEPNLAAIVWTICNTALMLAVFFRIGLRGWHAPALAAAVIMLGGPFSQVFYLGQVGIVLLALCVLDLAPGPTLIARVARYVPRIGLPNRLLPVGVLTGVAAAIKLTPVLFVVALVLFGRRRAAIVTTVSAVVCTMIGFIARGAESARYWGQLITGNFPGEANAAYQITNQSLPAVAVRALRNPELPLPLMIILGGGVVVVTLLAAVATWRRGEPLLAVLLVGLGSTIAPPISWTHAYVWVAPLAITCLKSGLPRALAVVTTGYWGWVTVEPFQVLNVDTEAGMRLGVIAQLVDASTPVMGITLLVLCWRWTVTGTPQPLARAQPWRVGTS